MDAMQIGWHTSLTKKSATPTSLDRFSGPGNRTAIQVDDPADAPETFEIPRDDGDEDDVEEDDVPTIEFTDHRNWMRREVDQSPPEEPIKLVEEMTEDEIRAEFGDRADEIIESLRESDEDTVV